MPGGKFAGGISYQTRKNKDYHNVEHLLNPEKSSEIFQKNKEYYLASANKIKARLILAKTRIGNVKLKENEALFLNQKISKGIKWIETLKINIQNAKDNLEFQKAVLYEEWHAVKLIPRSAEGYASSVLVEKNLEKKTNPDIKNIDNAHSHLIKAKNLLMNLLNSDKYTNFELAEKQLIKAYDELDLALKYLD